MLFQKITPAPALKPYVSSMWLLDSQTAVEGKDTLFPVGCLEIVFNLGNSTLISLLENKAILNPKVELLGQTTKAYSIGVKGHNRLLGLRFFPHTAALFLGGGMGKFTNSITDMSDVLGGELELLYRRLLDTPSLSDQLLLVERFLLKKLDAKRQESRQYQLIGWIIEQLNRNEQLPNQQKTRCLEETAFGAGISLRYLERLFQEFLGVSPTAFVKLTRLQKSFACLHQQSCSLTEVAYRSGYFDQSHFIRDFKSFTGMTPSQYDPGRFPLNNLFWEKA